MAESRRPFDDPFFKSDLDRGHRSRLQSRWGSWWDDPWGDMQAPSRLWDQHFGMGLMEDDLFPPTPFRGWYVRPRRVRDPKVTNIPVQNYTNTSQGVLQNTGTSSTEQSMLTGVGGSAIDQSTVTSPTASSVTGIQHDSGLGPLQIQTTQPSSGAVQPAMPEMGMLNIHDMGSGISEVLNTAHEFRVSLDVRHFKPSELSLKTTDTQMTICGTHEERADEHGMISRQFKRSYILPKEIDQLAIKSSLSADGVLTIIAPKKTASESKERVIPISVDLQ